MKTRLGFATTEEFDALLPIFARRSIDALTVHARTVAQNVPAARALRPDPAGSGRRCPALSSPTVTCTPPRRRGRCSRGPAARGLMIGRGRHPQSLAVRPDPAGAAWRGVVTGPTGRDVWVYIRALWESQASFDKPEKVQCDRMKKFVNFLGEGVPAPFLHQIRRADTADTFHRICAEFLDHERADGARAVRPGGPAALRPGAHHRLERLSLPSRRTRSARRTCLPRSARVDARYMLDTDTCS